MTRDELLAFLRGAPRPPRSRARGYILKTAMRTLTLNAGIVLCLLAPASGCGTWVADTPINPAPRPVAARPWQSVEVLSSTPPARDHVDVALLRVDQNYSVGDRLGEVMIQRLRERAGALGCDALYINGTVPSGFTEGVRTMSGTCIVYREPTVPGPARPSPPPRRTCVSRKDFEEHRDCIAAIAR